MYLISRDPQSRGGLSVRFWRVSRARDDHDGRFAGSHRCHGEDVEDMYKRASILRKIAKGNP